MPWTPPRDHPWRMPFPEDLVKMGPLPTLTVAEIKAIKIMRWQKISWASIAKIMACPAFIARKAMSPNYRPLKETW